MRGVLLFSLLLLLAASGPAQSPDRPNVLLIVTDDQGYGDLGYHGNTLIRTPTLDRLAGESVRFTNFYVSPVCAPTRASLMTGRYSLRTGVRDTYNGGAIMAGSEITLAELLAEAGYRTGIFGKWHLGDNYPSRPSDQGFAESLVHLGGGMGQPGDFTTFFRRDSSYFDPVLWHNNVPTAYPGYCTDIFADAATAFVRKRTDDDRPFFCYLAFNAPHTPLQVKEADYAPYADAPIAEFHARNGGDRHPLNAREIEDARRVYGMVSNIDDKLAKLFTTLDSLGVADNTIVIFMTDNGPQQYRYKAGLRGHKGQVYEGGIRVPFFLRFPGGLSQDTSITTPAAHIDVLPTLAELCGVALPDDRPIDGKSLVPLIREAATWPDRNLFFYWARRYPVPYHNMALLRGHDKLVGFTDYRAEAGDFALFDLVTDAEERTDLITRRPATGRQLFTQLDSTYRSLLAEPNLQGPVRIVIDTTQEHPVYLNRNDAGGQRAIWTQEEVYGKWALDVATPGRYRVTCRFIEPVPAGGTLYLEMGPQIYTSEIHIGGDSLQLGAVQLRPGPTDIVPFYEVDDRRIFPLWVRLE